MKLLTKPDIEPSEVYTSCISNIADQGLSDRLAGASAQMQVLAQQYEQRAAHAELFQFPASEWGKVDQLVFAGLTKAELTDLYTAQMSKRDRPGRHYYDRLMLLAPLGKCPFCRFGQVSTLDHFLSKARYPSFSVLPVNLIPSCADCNKGKGSDVIYESSQFSHPYFESSHIEVDKWLYAIVCETSPATASFSVAPPGHWPAGLSQRVSNYFHGLDLARRFSVEAASEMAALPTLLCELKTEARIGEYLEMVAADERSHRTNTWKAALYEALSVSAWYRAGGYRGLTT